MPEKNTKGMMREKRNQTDNDLKFIADIEGYWNNSPGTVAQKLDAFTKYASRQAITKFLARNDVFLKQLHINGSVVEIGVHRGASLMSWSHFSSIYEPVNHLRKIIGFDTFEGFPAIHEKDHAGTSEHLQYRGLDVGIETEQDLHRSINLYDVNRLMNHIPKVEIVRGDACQTIPEYINNNPHLIVSLLHIDVDIYEPTKTALECFVPRMPKGSVILFDELNLNLFPGETLATHEVLGINKLRICRFPYATSISYAVIE